MGKSITTFLFKTGKFLALILYFAATVSAQNSVKTGGGSFYIISGNVQANGAALPDAAVVLSDLQGNVLNSAAADENGDYSIAAVGEFDYAVGVFKDGYNFDPSYRFFYNLQSDQTLNFQNGVLLCVPALAGFNNLGFCPDGVPTNASQIVNGKIAFEIFGSAFAVAPDGTNQMQLPPAGAFPSWSFDGAKLIYNRSNGTGTDQEIFITNADGTGNRQITINFYSDYKAKFSPDGTRAAFYRLFNSSDIEIFTINTDSPNNGINEIQLTNDDCLNRDPVYSPDGAKIAFSKFCEDMQFSGIYTMNTDGSAPFQLTSGFADLSPAWKPDGSRIVFERDGDFWFVNPSGTGTMQLTFDLQFPYYSPVYSPDGTKIAFSRAPSETEFQEIYTLNPESSEQIRLTNSQGVFNKEYPSWQRRVAPTQITLAGLNLTFDTTTTAGNTVATPISPTSAGFLPQGFRLIPESVAYDVRTSAAYTGNIELCFDLSNVTDQELFETLVIFHNENGALVDRTTSRDFSNGTLCASVSSLSPFIVAAPLTPTAANVEVSGKIVSAENQGIANAQVLLTDSTGNTRAVKTSSFGFFRFEEIPAGQTYIVEINSKRFQFAPQIIAVKDNVADLIFVGTPRN